MLDERLKPMEERLESLEKRLAALTRAVKAVTDEWMPAVRARLDAAPVRKAGKDGRAGGPGSRDYRSNWPDLVRCKALLGAGLSVHEIARRLGLKYSTCHNLCYADTEREAALRTKWESKGGRPFGPSDVEAHLLNA